MKIFYMVYFLGIALFTLNSVSRALFAKLPILRKLRGIISAFSFSIMWPLSLFSDEGRAVILSKTKNL